MIKRIDPNKGMSRAVEFNGLIHFGGHVAAGKQPSMYEQSKALFARYDELFALHNTDKHHLVSAIIYIADMKQKSEMQRAWAEWIDPDKGPSRVCVEVVLEDGYLLEVSVIAAVKES